LIRQCGNKRGTKIPHANPRLIGATFDKEIPGTEEGTFNLKE
jgi:hypothetical protein